MSSVRKFVSYDLSQMLHSINQNNITYRLSQSNVKSVGWGWGCLEQIANSEGSILDQVS